MFRPWPNRGVPGGARLADALAGPGDRGGQRLPHGLGDSQRPRHSLAQALADVATIGLLQERAVHGATDLTGQLQRALNSRVVIEQAKGAVAERGGVDMDTAFAWLRGYARNNNRRLADVALAVVERTLPIEALRTSEMIKRVRTGPQAGLHR